MVKVFCVGNAVQDLQFLVKDMPTKGGKYIAHAYNEVGGGPAATAAVCIARLGGNVKFFGRIGDDKIGESIKKELESYNVNTDYMLNIANATSIFSSIIIDETGERLIVNYVNPKLHLSYNDITLPHSIILESNIILGDVRWFEGTELAFKLAKDKNIPTVLDADLTDKNIMPLVKLATYAVFSHGGLEKLVKEKVTKDNIHNVFLNLQKETEAQLFVTMGENGCYYMEDNNIKHVAAFKVNVVDTTGAGDVFHGAFALAIAENMNAKEALTFASATAALKCTKQGGRAGIPNKATLKEFLKNNNVII